MSEHSAPSAADVDQDRRGFLIFATAATGAVGAAFAAVPFIASWSPSERARAAGAPGEVDLSIPASGAHIRVIGGTDTQVVTPSLVEDATIVDGEAVSDPGGD